MLSVLLFISRSIHQLSVKKYVCKFEQSFDDKKLIILALSVSKDVS